MKIFDSLNDIEKETLIKLEEQDTKEREQELDKSVRLRQIPRETGEFLFNLLSGLISSNPGNWNGLEIGGSGGYSTMWQGLALKKQSIVKGYISRHTWLQLAIRVSDGKLDGEDSGTPPLRGLHIAGGEL